MVDYSQVMKATIVALCLAAGPGLQAGKIPLQNDQPATKKEGVDAFELRLQFKEKLAHCVDVDMHVDYCLAPRPEGVFSRGKKMKFYLNNKLVYNCSSSGVCTAHGALKENTRIKVASEGCKGIPFANINKDLIGEYVAVAEDPPERFKASFNLTFCNREKSLELSLELRGEAANCVSQSHRDGYCLSVSMDGQPIQNKAFKCYLGSHLAYECSTERVCTGHGILRDNIRPKYVASDCYGIPFANVVPQAEGKYSCVVEDDTFLIEASYDLGFCSGSHSPNITESQMEMTESVWNTKVIIIIAVSSVVSVVSVVVLSAVIIGIYICYKRCIKERFC
ncbi:uncharacterized protein LOC135214396 isoform X2 [Macrobrachium nipponense]